MSWSPSLYSKFEDDRTRPVRDLVAAIPGSPSLMVDIGCGPGNSTEVLAQRFPEAEVSGIDSSPDMVAAARERMPSVRFEVADVASWRPEGRYDVILSNAVLQWLPDHAGLLPRLAGFLGEGGSLAVQMPANLDEPAYVAMRAVADAPEWREKLARAGGKRGEMATADLYYRMLKPHCHRVDLWRTTYYHVLAGADAIVEWFKGSGLRPYLAALDPAERDEFLRRYRAEIARAYPALEDGSALLPFPRLFFVATR